MKLQFRIVDLTVEFLNPRTKWWEPVASFGSAEARDAALVVYKNHEYEGWESIKLSKSNQDAR